MPPTLAQLGSRSIAPAREALPQSPEATQIVFAAIAGIALLIVILFFVLKNRRDD